LAPYSIAPEANWIIDDARVRNPWMMTVAKGATITIEIEVVADPITLDHNLTIEGTDIDVTVGMGEKVTYDVTFNEVGTFKVFCNIHFGDMGPDSFIVVEE
jgi:plastocyanin